MRPRLKPEMKGLAVAGLILMIVYEVNSMLMSSYVKDPDILDDPFSWAHREIPFSEPNLDLSVRGEKHPPLWRWGFSSEPPAGWAFLVLRPNCHTKGYIKGTECIEGPEELYMCEYDGNGSKHCTRAVSTR